MLTWKTVGQHSPSSSSPVTCAQRAEESQRTGGTKQASMRLWIGMILPAKRWTSVGRRLVKAARVMVPEMKCELDLYEYVLVQTYF